MDTETIVNLITVEITKLNQHKIDSFSGDTLSRIAVRLAAYKAGLGEHSTMAKKSTWLAEKNYKESKAEGYIELKNEGRNSTDAKELIVLKAGDAYQALIEAKALEDSITTLSINVHDLIDAIKSRLINLQMEVRDERTF